MSTRDTGKATHSKMTRETYYLALAVEKCVAAGLKGRLTPLHHPFDVIVDDLETAVEVKTIILSERDWPLAIQRPGQHERKNKYLAEKTLFAFTLAVDYRGRTPRLYLREGHGTYQLGNMARCTNLKQVRRRLVASYRQRMQKPSETIGG